MSSTPSPLAETPYSSLKGHAAIYLIGKCLNDSRGNVRCQYLYLKQVLRGLLWLLVFLTHRSDQRGVRGGREDQKSCHRLIMNKTYSDGWVSHQTANYLDCIFKSSTKMDGYIPSPPCKGGSSSLCIRPLNSGQLWLRREVGCRLEIHFQISFRSVSDWSKCTAQQRGPLWLQGKHLVRWIWCVKWGCKV